jgi:hypothetical protein
MVSMISIMQARGLRCLPFREDDAAGEAVSQNGPLMRLPDSIMSLLELQPEPVSRSRLEFKVSEAVPSPGINETGFVLGEAASRVEAAGLSNRRGPCL